MYEFLTEICQAVANIRSDVVECKDNELSVTVLVVTLEHHVVGVV